VVFTGDGFLLTNAGRMGMVGFMVLAQRKVLLLAADMVNAGVDWVDEATVVDGNLISARTPADLGPWMKALLKALG
jgi:putative intracellular protease/amidase